MSKNRLFNQTKISLTCWYASIFSGIITLGALGVYEAIAHAHYITINQELKTVAGTFHDTLEPLLLKPNKLEKNVREIIPDLCLIDEKCDNLYYENRYITRLIQQGKYYLKFYDLSGNLLGNAGIKIDNLSLNHPSEEFKTIQDNQNNNYRQISLLLHSKNNQEWGYLQIGRSLEEFDQYLNNIKWLLVLGLPLLIILVIIASWYLAEKAMKPLDKSYQQMQQFSSDVAHELRTPLAAIKATIDSVMLTENLSIKDNQETLITINRQNQRLINLVNDLLILSRLDAINQNNYLLEKTDINLIDLINDVTEELSFLAIENKINLCQDIQIKDNLIIQGNEAQIYRLLTNLVVNAIQNTPESGLVTISLENNKKEVIMAISDTGIGISEEDNLLIFNRFYRVDKSRGRDKGNSGLGLAIVSSILLFHHGRIELESTINKGSIFTVYLPK
ncbi:phosphate regulon sensor protein PhoR [Geminocystis sp. NIES-3708]|uniref:two-component system sensor histidine kinase RppB n=1 Tax=Geminocystis sp. NIES-3708 TaxID=1615909 RepID=UPI0005FC7E30|nr:two-component system sensor histidine kinase RppB [Geminocystis sp. NIES-3708]BAQ62373.1 phosphate regulon sensor protein PhoR [Geminocystis sp. NIES-3708]